MKPKGFQGDPLYCGGAVEQGGSVNLIKCTGLGAWRDVEQQLIALEEG